MTELDNLIKEHSNYIYGLTRYFENYSSKEDLFQAGAIGLMTAYGKYDPSFNVKFTTYAFSYIMGEMRKCIRQDKVMKVGRSISKLSLQIEKTYLLLTQKYMREPTMREIAEFLEVPEYLIEEAMRMRNRPQSIDEAIYTDGKPLSLHETIPSNNVDINTLLALKEELLSLGEPEKSIMEERYFNDLTQSETAKKLGLTQVQVSRKEQKVLTILRNNLLEKAS